VDPQKTFVYRNQSYKLTDNETATLVLEKHMTEALDRTIDVAGPWSLTGLCELEDGALFFHTGDERLEFRGRYVGIRMPPWSLTEISGVFHRAYLRLEMRSMDAGPVDTQPAAIVLTDLPAKPQTDTWQSISRGPSPPRLAQQIKSAIEDSYTDDATLEELARSLNLKASAFSLCFSRAYGLSPKRYQTLLRVHHSVMEMLRNQSEDRRVIDTAFEAGYQDLSRFNKQFRTLMDLRPKDILNLPWQ
jgi:AraC-like DNA-binding protein